MEEKNPATSSDTNKNAPAEEVQSASQPQSSSLSSEGDTHVNPADMQNISVNRISIPEILVIVGIIVVVLLIGAASYILLTHRDLIEQFEVDLARIRSEESEEVVELAEEVEEFVETEVDPMADWQIYEVNDLEYLIQYPQSFSISQETKEGLDADEMVIFTSNDLSQELVLLINPSDFNEIYAEKFSNMSLSEGEFILNIPDEEGTVPDEMLIEGKKRIYVEVEEDLEGFNIGFLYTYDEGIESPESTLSDILSTFKPINSETDEVLDGDMTSFSSDELGLTLTYPSDVKKIEGESYVLFYLTNAEDTAIVNNIYNGVNLRFSLGDLQGSTVQEYVTTELDGINGGTGDTTLASEVNYGGVNGYLYSSDSGISKKYIYLPGPNGKYLLIVDSTGDLNNSGYREIADQILNSVTIN